MDSERISALSKSLRDYSSQITTLEAKNFTGNAIKAFKKYYNAMHIELVEYVKYKKDKSLADKVKEIQSASDIFKSTNMWIAILSAAIVFPGILLIYLYQIKVEDWLMITATVVTVITIFILIRKVQTQPKTLSTILKSNGKKCEKIASIIVKSEQKQISE